jgi:hypothetical protein
VSRAKGNSIIESAWLHRGARLSVRFYETKDV